MWTFHFALNASFSSSSGFDSFENHDSTISKPGCYYCILLQSQYLIRIMALLFAIKALLLQLLFCKCPDYYSLLLHYLQKDYYCTYGNTIISLIVFGIHYCYYCYYHTIIYIIVNTHYYDYYVFWEVLLQLLFSKPIIGIITIIYYYFKLLF